MTLKFPLAILKISPESIAFAVSNAVWYKRLPDVEASLIPIQPTVPHEAVAVGNVTSALLVDTPLDGAPNVTDVLAYEPPDTSVPLPASVGSVVHNDDSEHHAPSSRQSHNHVLLLCVADDQSIARGSSRNSEGARDH